MAAKRGGRISKTRKAVKRPARRTLEKRPRPAKPRPRPKPKPKPRPKPRPKPKPKPKGPKGGAKTTRHRGKTTQRAKSDARRKEFINRRNQQRSAKMVPLRKKATKRR